MMDAMIDIALDRALCELLVSALAVCALPALIIAGWMDRHNG